MPTQTPVKKDPYTPVKKKINHLKSQLCIQTEDTIYSWEIKRKLLDIERNPDSYTTEDIRDVSIKAMKLYNADNHFFLTNMVTNTTLGFVTNHTEELIKEYDCTTASEKILAQSIAGAYGQYLELSNVNKQAQTAYTGHDINGYYSMMEKKADNAFRRYMTALKALQQKKAPKMNINIHTKQAFVAENQQLNNA